MNQRTFVNTYMWAYNNDKTSLDVAKRLGTDIQKVYSTANQLRKRGVKLPFLNKESGHYMSVDDLNGLITRKMEA